MSKTTEKVGKLLIGEKVKQLYIQKALSQKELAAKADVTVKTIQRLENGEHAKGDTLQRIAKALDVPVTEFSLLNLDNGRVMQMSSQELNGLKMSLNDFLENGKINREEYQEMRELIGMAENGKVEFAVPPLPQAPKEVEATPDEPTELLERLDFIGAIKRVLAETKLWVKYAPVDKNQLTLAHKLRDRGFIYQPYFCETERSEKYRVGLFNQGFSSHYALYLIISRYETNEGVVVQLWPYHHGGHSSDRPELLILYRSLSNHERLFIINMRDFQISSLTQENYHFSYYQFFPELLNATQISKS